jgi:hypothetical protein
LKAEIPETLPYHIAALNVERCGDKICMSEDDFQQSEQDKDNLAAMKQALELENQSRARNNNSLVDVLVHRTMEAERRAEEAQHLERALSRERTSNTLQMWVERILWLGGIYVMGNL